MGEAMAAGTFPRVAGCQLPRYPVNSAVAAARIVALALIANGRIKSVEVATLDAVDAPALLGLDRAQWHRVIRTLCVDLLRAGVDQREALSASSLHEVLDDVTDPSLRKVCAALSVAVIHADCLVDGAELALLEAMQDRWGIAFRTGAAPVAPMPVALRRPSCTAVAG